MTNLASLTGGDGDYQLTLDLFNFPIFTVANGERVSIDDFGLGPNLVENGSFDEAGGGSNNLDGWTHGSVGVHRQLEPPHPRRAEG